MALKEEIAGVKQSLSAEEEFLENVIKSEFFIKKHKKLIISILVILAVIGSGIYLAKTMKAKSIERANEAYAALVIDPNDTANAEKLKKENAALYALYEFRKAMDNKDSAKLSELAGKTAIDPLLKELINFEANGESDQLMGSYASFLKGYKLIKEGKIQEAHNEFNKIPSDSKEFGMLIKYLKHYNGNKK